MSLTDSLGVGPELVYKGKVYRMAPMDQLNVRARYCQYLRQRAVSEVMSLRGELDPLAIDSMLSSVTRDFAAGLYEFGSQVVRESLKSPDSQQRLVLYMLQENHSEVEPALVKEMFENCLGDVLAAVYSSDAVAARPKAVAPTVGT